MIALINRLNGVAVNGYNLPPAKATVVIEADDVNVFCKIGSKEIPPLEFSKNTIEKIFPARTTVLFNLKEGEDRLSSAIVKGFLEEIEDSHKITYLKLAISQGIRNFRDLKRNKLELFNESLPAKAQLFEVPVTNGLYTYVLAFSDACFIRTPLMKKIELNGSK